LDAIFFIPISKSSPIPIVQDGSRETDSVYIGEIDNLFKAIFHLYQHNFDNNPFLPNDDCPAIIEIFGNPVERIMLLQQYLNVDGAVIGDEGGSILDPENIKDLENLLMEQMTSAERESVYKREKQLVDEFEKKKQKGKKLKF
jgi:hypothetical protein